jgi:hypothetical protein
MPEEKKDFQEVVERELTCADREKIFICGFLTGLRSKNITAPEPKTPQIEDTG